MDTTDELTGLPAPPPERGLPDHGQRRERLLAAMRATGPGRRPRARRRWLAPLAAAAAIAAIVVAIAVVRTAPPPAPRVSHRESYAANTVQGKPTLAGGQWRQTDTFTAAGPVLGIVIHAGANNIPKTGVGEVTVTGTDSSRVVVTEHISYHGAPPGLSNQLAGGAVVLGYQCASGDGCKVGYDVQVPRNIGVTVSDNGGTIRLAALTGSLTATANLGTISGTGLADGSAQLTANLGQINVSFATPPRLVQAVANLGSITVQVPRPGPYAVTATANGGSTSVTVPQAASASRIIKAAANLGSVSITGS